MTVPATKAEALALGVRTFFPGTPCANGHIAERIAFPRRSACVECNRAGARRGKRRYYEKNKDAERSKARVYQAKLRASKLDWGSRNPEAFAEMKSVWKKANLERGRASAMKRKAIQLQAQPKWLSPEQKAEMLSLYREAVRKSKDTGIRHEVDHIVPLQGRTVCGLHVPWNLRVLTAIENNSRPRIWHGEMEMV